MEKQIKVVLLALILMLGGVSGSLGEELVWLCPAEPTKSFSGAIYASTDYFNLFTSTYSSQWSQSRARVKVFKVYSGFIQRISIAQLQSIVTYLKSNGIALALEWPPLVNASYALEGFAPAGTAKIICDRVKSVGGTIDYIAMDEPLYYGHYYASGPQYSVQELASNAAGTLKQFQSYFPAVIIGDIEPIDAMPAANWKDTTRQWLAAYQVAMGAPLAFFHVDNMWGSVWTSNIPELNSLLVGSNIKLGVIFNTLSSASTSSQWMQSAEVNIQRYNASGIVKPEHVVFQNWMAYPTTLLPETSPNAYTYLVNYYYGSYATQAPPLAFIRMMKGGIHFYSANATEVSQFSAAGWATEGNAGRVYLATAGAGSLSPFYRLSKTTNGVKKYFYTANTTERNNCITLYGYADEGISGYVFTNSSSGGVPLYRAYSSTYGHFYTNSLTEYNGLSTTTWTKEGTACYLP